MYSSDVRLSSTRPLGRHCIRCRSVPTDLSSPLLHASSSSISRPKSLFVFGINGYTSSSLCRQLYNKGWSISGTMRNIPTAPSSSSPWKKVYEFDPGLMALSRSSLLSSPSPSAHPGALSEQGIESLLSSSHVLLSIPPLGLPNYDPVLQEQLKLMKEYTGLWVGYLSSTSVYGDWGGDWVDEMVVPNPKTAKGIQRRAAEEAWEAQDHLPLHIFRLGGIYGNGRSALDVARRKREEGGEGSQSGSSLNREAKRFTSRIHVLDICLAVEASMMQPGTGEKGRSLYYYNLVDDDPAPRSEVVRYAQDLIKLPGEDEVRVASSEGVVARTRRSAKLPLEERESEEKRVSNARMKDLLLSSGLMMLYPSYKEGLQAILSEISEPARKEAGRPLG